MWLGLGMIGLAGHLRHMAQDVELPSVVKLASAYGWCSCC